MFWCLQRMNYPQQFVEFIKILYQEMYSQVQNKGHMCNLFNLSQSLLPKKVLFVKARVCEAIVHSFVAGLFFSFLLTFFIKN